MQVLIIIADFLIPVQNDAAIVNHSQYEKNIFIFASKEQEKCWSINHLLLLSTLV
jgi:hypothetical protein